MAKELDYQKIDIDKPRDSKPLNNEKLEKEFAQGTNKTVTIMVQTAQTLLETQLRFEVLAENLANAIKQYGQKKETFDDPLRGIYDSEFVLTLEDSHVIWETIKGQTAWSGGPSRERKLLIYKETSKGPKSTMHKEIVISTESPRYGSYPKRTVLAYGNAGKWTIS